VLDANVPLRDNKGNAMGRGSHAIAAIWNGREIIGFIFMDNLLRKQPLTERDRELLELYASTFGHLYSLKKTEEALARAYAELKESQTQCIQAEKMEVVGRLASGVAHEVKNPLGIIMQGVNYLEKTIPSKNEEITETLDTIKANIRRANQIIASLLDFSKATSVDLRPEDANAILEDAMLLVRFRFKYGPIAIVSEMKKDLPRILADRNKMEQVFVNVMLNAAQAMPEGGRLIIRSYSKHLGEAENGIQIKNGGPFAVGEKAVIIEIEDTGKGISQEDIRKIFDPFFTTKGPTGGAGLGLPVTRSILSIHRGLINVESRESKGTKVTIILKVSEGA
jgi:signal transduction histidine kinase